MKSVLYGSCKCGVELVVEIDLPEAVVSDKSHEWAEYPAPHLVFNCPVCHRLVNVTP